LRARPSSIAPSEQHNATGAVPGLGDHDTVKMYDDSGLVTQTLGPAPFCVPSDATGVSLALYARAHEAAAAAGIESLTDDGAVVEWGGQAAAMCSRGDHQRETGHPG